MAEPTPEPTETSESPYDDHPAIQRYKALTRYPPSTRRLYEDSFDLLNPNARHERRQTLAGGDDGEDLGWEALFTADRYFVRGDERVTISLSLWYDGDAVTPRDVVMVASAVAASSGESAVDLAVDSLGAGAIAVFSPDRHWPDLVGEVRVAATFSAEGLREQTGYLTFYFTAEGRIPARFTGTFQDSVIRGDLVIEVGLEVEVAGIYRIEGNLLDADGKPFGFARFEGTLAEGAAVAPIAYYGLLFHDAEARPPFSLSELRGYRMRPGDSPHREDIPAFEGVYRTRADYRLSDFRRDQADNPRREEMLDLYRDAIERGVQLTEPELVGRE